MAKALFGSVVDPRQLGAAQEIAALRARVARLEAEVAQLRAERDDRIARELLTMATPETQPALA
ncbi:hypothetical protein [Klenkia sp. PcliD-1-E]|jgi:cell division protein FtsB|uniref:hypothetical protein n=1 Tax=Klenkia sp. PcliD-1-E TaxID=2954492 RepID=UPI0020969EEA|nr:hypothetical protein [Klenkia sp. PcliD-1-E]MCO7222103.1 hypothetical protein [Klenkia sp. PcliD-1-E]